MLVVILLFFGSAFSAMATEAEIENIQVETSILAVERGAETLINACHGCHSLKYVRYRDLAAFGINTKKIDEWRGDQPLDASLTSLMTDDAALQSFGTKPPDLSLITKTPEGMAGNHIFPETKMPDALGISGTVDSAQLAVIKRNALDVVSFLSWAADPHEKERHELGYYVIGYLIILTLLLYFVKDQVWSRLSE